MIYIANRLACAKRNHSPVWTERQLLTWLL